MSTGATVITILIVLVIFYFILNTTINSGPSEYSGTVRDTQKKIDKAFKEYDKYMYYSHIEHKDYEKAIFHITNAINLNPIGKYYCSRGIIKKAKNDYHDAIQDFDKSLDLEPNNTLSLYCRASAYHSLGEMNLAYNDWKRAGNLGSVGATNALELYFKDYIPESSSSLLAQKNIWIELKTNEIIGFESLLDLLKNTDINRINYRSLLKCFEWQFKRFKILVRDNYQCVDCNAVSDKLHVHHTYYLKDSTPWEIDDSALISLCRQCHYKRHQLESIKVYNKIGNQLALVSHNFMFCHRCFGTGYLPQFRHVENGICFLCNGEIPKTIFSKCLTTVSRNKKAYDEQLNGFLDFIDGISLDYYSENIYNKIHVASIVLNDDDRQDDFPF